MRKPKGSAATMPAVLSYQSCPAKTFLRPDGAIELGRTVVEHCQIVGAVALELISRYPPALARDLFPVGSALAAAAHDIGKVSPYFVEKLRKACTQGHCSLIPLTGIDPALESQWGGHAGVSQVTASALGIPNYIPEILGQHHGFSPAVAGYRATDELFGGSGWAQERVALVQDLQSRLACDWPIVSSDAQARLIAGLTSVSDWVGSGELFENPVTPWVGNISRAVDEAGFVRPTFRDSLSFEQIFGFQPREPQRQLIAAAVSPGVYVLEAPMGAGKTEASLYAAYQRMAAGEATGIYFALPTQLTSNKIFDRFNEFLRKTLASDCQHKSLLLHGNAWLLHTDMGEEGRPGGAWFSKPKRGLLAPFAVGTLDQALMAAMNVKHGFVRAFGLAGKVVILDEVHTYDAYTGSLLDELIRLLVALRCTVIILTATLSHARRHQLLAHPPLSDDYPLISAVPDGESLYEIPIVAPVGLAVAVRLLKEQAFAIEEALARAQLGQQVIWIENTVGEAQQRYFDLAARATELGIVCGLLHSRFTVDDRQVIEDRWVDLFGKPGWGCRQLQGRILIGTQVLEQSLDIDADFIISRFAPTDMLLQRLGRLWRHKETPRPASAACEAWILVPDLAGAVARPAEEFGNSAFVYSPYVLCRSLEVWQRRTDVRLPADIRPLIEQTYVEREEEGCMAAWLSELEHGKGRRLGRKALQQLARVALARGGVTLPENKAQTRYSDTESAEVLIVKSIELFAGQKTSLITLLDDQQVHLPWERHRLTKRDWRQLSALLMRQIVVVRENDAPAASSLGSLERIGLQHCFYLGTPDHEEARLRVALRNEIHELEDMHGRQSHVKHVLVYRRDVGYQIVKR